MIVAATRVGYGVSSVHGKRQVWIVKAALAA